MGWQWHQLDHMQIICTLLQTDNQTITRRRSCSFAEYWKNFVARFNDVHAFGYNSAGSEWIWVKFGALRVYCLEVALADFGRDLHRSESGSASRNFVFFLWAKQRAISPISGQTNFTKFAHKTWIYVAMNPFWNIYENLPVRGLFSKNVNFCLNIISNFRLQAAISPKWIQIAESHDRLPRLWNVAFPFVPLESTESHSPGLYSTHE